MVVKRGAIFVITSGKGGCGKSVFAANFAIALKQETGGSVALLDMNTEFCGDASHAAGVQSYGTVAGEQRIGAAGRGMIDLVNNIEAITPRILLAAIPQTSVGVSILNLKTPGEGKREIPYDKIGAFLELVARSYSLVVVDLCTGYSGKINQACMERANAVFVMLEPELFSIFSAMKSLAALQQLSFSQQMIYPVLNRYSPRKEFTPSIIEAKIKRDIFATIPEDENFFTTAQKMNKAAIILQPRHPVSKAYGALAARLWGMDLCSPKKSVQVKSEVSVSEESVESAPKHVADTSNHDYDDLKIRIHQRLVGEIDLKALDEKALKNKETRQSIRDKTKVVIDRLIDEEANDEIDRETRIKISHEMLNEAFGLGPLEALLEDGSITEIMCNGPDRIYVEKRGKLWLSSQRFLGEKYLRATIDRIVMKVGRRVDELSPMVDARLEDGSRVNVVIPPLSPDGCLLTIRKFSKEPLVMRDLITFGTLNDQMAELLKLCVEASLNIVISGGTGSGKTTLLNVLSSYIPSTERIVTIEDSTELQLQQEHVCRLESRPENIEGSGEIVIRDLVRNALRMRPDRIVVGECRGAEAIDMLQAMNTGHDGSMTTIHANSIRDAIHRLETLVLFAGLDLPSRAIREQVASAVNIIIQQDRQPDGSRKVVAISEITGIEGDSITTQDIFLFRQTGCDETGKLTGEFVASGLIPNFMSDLEHRGFKVPSEIFM